MAGFLRKKSKQQPQISPVKLQSPPRPVEPPSQASTPLFARFASSTSPSQDASSSHKPMVSGPMVLTSRKEAQSQHKQQVVVPPVPTKTQAQQGMLRRDEIGQSTSPRHEPDRIDSRIASSTRSPSYVARSPISPSSPQSTAPKTRVSIDKPLPNPSNNTYSADSPSFGNSPPATPTKNPRSPYEPASSAIKPNSAPYNPFSRSVSSQYPGEQSKLQRTPSQQPGSTQPDPRNSTQKKRQSLTQDSLYGESSKLPANGSAYDISSNSLTASTSGTSGPPSAFRQVANRKSSLPSQSSSSNSNDSHNSDDFELWLRSTNSQSSDATDVSVSSPQTVTKGLPRKPSLQSITPADHTQRPPESTPSAPPSGPTRGKPLIFSAMNTPEDEPPTSNKTTTLNTSFSRQNPASSYPSPPAEWSPILPSFQSLPLESQSSVAPPSPIRGRRELSPPPNDTNRRQSVMSARTRSVIQTTAPPAAPSTTPQHTSPPQPPRKPSTSHRDASSNGHRTLTKQRPNTPTKQRPTTPKNRPVTPVSPERKTSVMSSNSPERSKRFTAALIDDDPFAKTQSIRMLKPSSRDGPPPSREGLSSREGLPLTASTDALSMVDGLLPPPSREQLFSQANGSVSFDDLSRAPTSARPSTGKSSMSEKPFAEDNVVQEPEPEPAVEVSRTVTPPPVQQGSTPASPASPEEYKAARSKRRGGQLEKAPPPAIQGLAVREDRPPEPFPLASYLEDPILLSSLMAYLSYYDWCNLFSVSKDIRTFLRDTKLLREEVLERFLRTVGYSRWVWPEKEPLALSLTDLHNYMRGVSIPTYEYSRVAESVVQSLSIPPSQRDPSLKENADQMVQATRAYNRVLLRLRAQAEKELQSGSSAPSSFKGNDSVHRNNHFASRASSRAPSPTRSMFSHGGHSNANQTQITANAISAAFSSASRSPLFRLRRAPLLRVFVPSPEGDWLSDASVLECEAELKLAGLRELVRFGDVVWDIAVGDEGNVGRMIWDGQYLIDLDYTYSTVGDLPKYIPALAFPPSYFHRVIRTGPTSSNPIIRIDLSPWGPEIAANLQLLQDRVRTETPQGAYHNVVRWVHRSSFLMRPSAGSSGRRSSSRSRGSPPSTSQGRIPIPDTNGLYVDPGWFGTIVVETEGTNESLADLQERCGPGAFPPRLHGASSKMTAAGREKDKDSKTVFRILRERSRPGEIWIRAASPKERLM